MALLPRCFNYRSRYFNSRINKPWSEVIEIAGVMFLYIEKHKGRYATVLYGNLRSRVLRLRAPVRPQSLLDWGRPDNDERLHGIARLEIVPKLGRCQIARTVKRGPSLV